MANVISLKFKERYLLSTILTKVKDCLEYDSDREEYVVNYEDFILSLTKEEKRKFIRNF